MKTTPSLAVALAIAVIGVPTWAEEIVRLEPGAFTQLPTAVRSGLTQLGCTVPQSFQAKRPENVIRGSFSARGAKEWAVLCSVNGMSDIVLFRSNSAEPIARLSEAPDDAFVQEFSPGRSGYSRLIAAGGRSAAGLNAIHDIYLESASTIWFRAGSGWKSRSGAD